MAKAIVVAVKTYRFQGGCHTVAAKWRWCKLQDLAHQLQLTPYDVIERWWPLSKDVSYGGTENHAVIATTADGELLVNRVVRSWLLEAREDPTVMDCMGTEYIGSGLAQEILKAYAAGYVGATIDYVNTAWEAIPETDVLRVHGGHNNTYPVVYGVREWTFVREPDPEPDTGIPVSDERIKEIGSHLFDEE